MYPVSNAFLRAVQENTRRYYWTGRITTTSGTVHEFDEKDILKGSGYISSQCCGSTEIELGTAYDIIQMCCKACKVTFAHTQEEITTWSNAQIVLSLYAENDIETYRDVLFYMGQILGGFFVSTGRASLSCASMGRNR